MQMMKKIIIQYDEYAQLPSQQDYVINSNFDEIWYQILSNIKKDLSLYLEKNDFGSLDQFEFGEYHHGLNRYHIYIYDERAYNFSMLHFFREQAEKNNCFFELECFQDNYYIGLISLSEIYFVYNSVARDGCLLVRFGLEG